MNVFVRLELSKSTVIDETLRYEYRYHYAVHQS